MKEEFETIAKNMGYSIAKKDGVYLNINVIILETGYLAGRNSLDEKIKKLIEFEKIDKIRIEEGLEEIKKLREAFKYILQLEDTISNGKIPQFFLKSTGRRYKANKETCINDIRRILMYFWNIKIKALKELS